MTEIRVWGQYKLGQYFFDLDTLATRYLLNKYHLELITLKTPRLESSLWIYPAILLMSPSLGAHFLKKRSICGRRDSNKDTLTEDSRRNDDY